MTNEQIIKELNYFMSKEDDSFSVVMKKAWNKAITDSVKKALEQKDQEKREIIESVPNGKGLYYDGTSPENRHQSLLRWIMKWKKEQLSKLNED